MQTAHGHAWECRAPSHNPIVFEEETQYQEHSVAEHGVPEAHVGMLSRAARRPVLDKVSNCPFGDDFQPSDKVVSNAIFSSEALQLHVAGHMKEIALLALQKLPSDDDEHAENVDSDQPLEDDGPTGAIGAARQSMYSMLEDEDLDFQDESSGDADNNPKRLEEEISAWTEELALKDKEDMDVTKFHHAIQASDLDLVKSLLQSGKNVDCRDESGSTPLHYAAKKGLAECVVILVEHGANIEITDNYGFSPLLWATVAGHEDATVRLLDTGANINSSRPDGRPALSWAASLGHSPTAQTLLEYGADLQTTQQNTPLALAAASGSLPIIRTLLQHGADPNHRDRAGWSAIHWAAEEGHEMIVRCLSEHGADIRAVSSYGTSPLHCAANGGHSTIANLLLSFGADPLKSTCHGWTALHHAAFMGHSRVVDLLLRHDHTQSIASLQDNHGWSALHLAVCSRDSATIHMLLDRSSIVDLHALVDESGLTAEEWLDRNSTSHSQRATNNLAFSKSRCCQPVTELRDAVACGNATLINHMLDTGYHINGMNSGRRTALYHAAKHSMYSIMDLLLDRGADPTILPTGRKSWEEFISDNAVLQRLKRAGYQSRPIDIEMDRQVRQALEKPSQPYDQLRPHSPEAGESQSSEPTNFDFRGPVGSSSPGPMVFKPLSLQDNSLTSPPISTAPKNDNKRKVKSGRTDWFKRLMGGRQ